MGPEGQRRAIVLTGKSEGEKVVCLALIEEQSNSIPSIYLYLCHRYIAMCKFHLAPREAPSTPGSWICHFSGSLCVKLILANNFCLLRWWR